MNWIDWVLLAAIALAAFKGRSRGFIVEVGSLVALVAGVWAGIHLSDQVVEWLGLGVRNAVVAFFITFLVVILAVHLLARFLTTVIDVAQLGLPNKAAGVLFGALRSVFMLSILLNLVAGYTRESWPDQDQVEASRLHAPVRSLAPMVFPDLGSTKWVDRAMDSVRDEADRVLGN